MAMNFSTLTRKWRNKWEVERVGEERKCSTEAKFLQNIS